MVDQESGCAALAWLRTHVTWQPGNAADFWYERMASQSGQGLPVIYQPFDGRRRGHFVDRGQILDFALSVGPGRVLDFGPGDGWPSLLIAPLVAEVVGVDGSARRVAVCDANARRLGLTNVRFQRVPPGEPLPFADGAFDGIVAASSIEQTPDPQRTLAELGRVLRPGGRLRMHYESLSAYPGREQEVALGEAEEGATRLLIFDRRIADESVQQYGMLFDLPVGEVKARLAGADGKISVSGLTPTVLEALTRHLRLAVSWVTRHPSCRTWLRWLGAAGLGAARPTYDGGWFARRLFDRLPEDERPSALPAVDALLRPLVDVVRGMEAPAQVESGAWEPWITAAKSASA